jgi:hypothetical protein
MKLNSIAVVTVLFVIILLSIQVFPVKASSETASIEMANSSINQAFTNVLAAEATGGNVTDLLTRLNGAGELLVEAERANQSGNLEDVNSKADNAVLIANQVKSDAATLTVNSQNNSANRFLLTATFSTVAIALLLIALSYVWRRTRRRYYRKLLGSKPEVVNNQT